MEVTHWVKENVSSHMHDPNAPLSDAKKSKKEKGLKLHRGLPKKGGGGGKGTWGKPGDEINSVQILDKNDPNYNSEDEADDTLEDIPSELNVKQIDKLVKIAIEEYFDSNDVDVIIEELGNLNVNENRPRLLKLAVEAAFEKKNAEREMVSILIAEARSIGLFTLEEAEDGFDMVLEDLEDAKLDNPQACEVLGKLIARAVADDCIPPIYIQKNVKGAAQIEALTVSKNLLHMKLAYHHLDTIWGKTSGRKPVRVLSNQINMIIKEFADSEDLHEAERCLVELEVQHFHHEFVYQTVLFCIENDDKETKHGVSLLEHLYNCSILTVDQIKRGFERVYSEIPDLVLDNPGAYKVSRTFVEECLSRKIISQELADARPKRGKKRLLSEGDGGKIIEDYE